MENQTAETTTATPSAPPQQSAPKRTSKWLMIGVPVAVIAALAFGYQTGHLQQAAGYVQQVAGKASTTIASYVPGAQLRAGTAKDSLVAAREAFAAGDMKAAIEGYQAIIAKNPNDMAARGEMGNVYYAMGATNEAAQAYFETAKLAIEQNQMEVAEALMPAVSEGNPMLADQLSDKLFDALMRTGMQQPDMTAQPEHGQQRS